MKSLLYPSFVSTKKIIGFILALLASFQLYAGDGDIGARTLKWGFLYSDDGRVSSFSSIQVNDNIRQIDAAPFLNAREMNAVNMLPCPCSFFTPADAPPTGDDNRNDAAPVETGLKFQTDANGFIHKIRFYKSDLDVTGVHTGNLWQVTGPGTGTLLSSIVFSGETASGWQEADFPVPVAVAPGTTYVASINSSDGYYAATNNYFNSAINASPLIAIATGDPDGPNGVFDYDFLSTGAFYPTLAFMASNYWIDVVFDFSVLLPVNFVNFKGHNEKNDVSLTWQVSTEQNNRGFEIQRSTDGRSWSAVGFVNGAGQSNTTRDYKFIDKGLASGIYNYRLKQVDFDNNYKLSDIITVLVAGGKEILLYQNFPNPLNRNSVIRYVLPTPQKVKLSLYDLHGREIKILVNEFKEAGSYTVNFDAGILSKGIYYYKLVPENGNGIVRKMVIQ